MRAELGQETRGARLRAFAQEYGAKFHPAAYRLLDNAKTLNGALACGGEFAPAEGLSQLLHEGMMAGDWPCTFLVVECPHCAPPTVRIIRERVTSGNRPDADILRASVFVLSYFAINQNLERTPVRVEMVKINSETPEPSLIRYAADQIRAGQVLGMPTDTFYGLAADPFNLRAVERVYEIKSRSRHKPLSLLIEDVSQAEELAKPLPEEFHALAKKFWPGPLTIIVKAASKLPLKVTANTGNVALRVPNAKIPLAVVEAAGIPITATSANLSGESECTTAEAVRDQLGVRIPIIVDGGSSPRETPSTIVDLTDEEARWKILREGAISAQEISEFFAQG
jgi:L-threonylcarbamoyladenylate synthase